MAVTAATEAPRATWSNACRTCRRGWTRRPIRPPAGVAEELVSAVVQMYGAGLEQHRGLADGGRR